MSSAQGPGFRRTMTVFWVYTLLRFGIFFVLWGIFWLLGLEVFVAGLIAVVVSVPLSVVLLARQRTALGRVIEQRAGVRGARKAALDAQLQGIDERQAWESPSDDDKRH